MSRIKNEAWLSVGVGTYGKVVGVRIKEDAKLSIGKYCSIADNVQFILGRGHNTKYIANYPLSAKLLKVEPEEDSAWGSIVVENDVWIGRNAILLPGSLVHNGAIIGAGAVVRGEVPDYTIMVGNPAQVWGYRFSPCEVDKLLQIAWWDWPRDKIIKHARVLESGDVKRLYEIYEKEILEYGDR